MKKAIPLLQMLVMPCVALILYPFFKIHLITQKRQFLKNASAGDKNLYSALERVKK